MKDKLQWGVVGTGGIATDFANALSRSKRCRIVNVTGLTPELSRAFADKWRIPTTAASLDELLADKNVEAVYIGTPHPFHEKMTMAAIAAGKHVLCEKPIALAVEEVDAIATAAEANQVVVTEAFMYRHHPQSAKVRELVAGGAVGRLCTVKTTFSFPLEDLSNVRALPELDGGALMDVGCYCVSIARLLAGEPERVTGEQVTTGGVDVRFTGLLRFPGDVLAHFDSGLDLPDQGGLEVLGSDGMLAVADPFHCFEPGIRVRPNAGEPRTVAVELANSYQLELENLAAAAAGTAEPLLGRDDALGQARAIDALYRSATEGRAVAL
jgi:predicted dehydrogenase